MKHENFTIPEHLQERWQEVNEELAQRSIEVNEANRLYLEAIIARLALNQEIQDWESQ